MTGGAAGLSEVDFARLRRLVSQEAGIHLGPARKAMVEARLARRLRELGLDGYGAYTRRALADPAERTRLIEALCTHETRFFRESRQLEFVERQLLPSWRSAAGRRPRRVRAWSAGCATGEEAWTLAMLLRTGLPATEGWSVDVTATDLSTRALAEAVAGVYRLADAEHVPPRYRRDYVLRGTGAAAGTVTVTDELRALVRFRQLNLNAESYPIDGALDLIACRNVLIYFDAAGRARVIRQLLRHLAPDGCLLLGQAECLTGIDHPLRPVGPMVWTWRTDPR